MLPVRPAAMLASIKFTVGGQESVFVARVDAFKRQVDFRDRQSI
jgi:hypothetical protein